MFLYDRDLVMKEWMIFFKHSWLTGKQGKGEVIFLTPLYHFYPLHSYLDISWAITAELRASGKQASSERRNKSYIFFSHWFLITYGKNTCVQTSPVNLEKIYQRVILLILFTTLLIKFVSFLRKKTICLSYTMKILKKL